jgi:predicted ribosomally synthesized peptide with SipW-like signal peptide
MKKILASLMVIALVAGLVGAGMSAYFSDTETSTGNTFTAGTLDLQLTRDGTNAIVPFNVADVKPGDYGYQEIWITNAGSLAGTLQMWISDIVGNEGYDPESEPQLPANDGTYPGELDQALAFPIQKENGNGVWTAYSFTTAGWDKSISNGGTNPDAYWNAVPIFSFPLAQGAGGWYGDPMTWITADNDAILQPGETVKIRIYYTASIETANFANYVNGYSVWWSPDPDGWPVDWSGSVQHGAGDPWGYDDNYFQGDTLSFNINFALVQ